MNGFSCDMDRSAAMTYSILDILAEPVKMHLIIVKCVKKIFDSVLKNNVKNALKELCSLLNSYHDKLNFSQSNSYIRNNLLLIMKW